MKVQQLIETTAERHLIFAPFSHEGSGRSEAPETQPNAEEDNTSEA